MNHEDDDARLDEIIARAADIGRVEFDRGKWLDRIALEQQTPGDLGARPDETKSEPHRNIWRTIMESKVTRYSVAAVVALAVGVILTTPDTRLGSQGVVLADVVEKVGQMGTCVGTCSRTLWEQDGAEPSLQAKATLYVSPDQGYMEEQYDDEGNLTHRAYILSQSRRFVLVMPSERKYMELSLSEEIFDRFAAALTPGGLLARITAAPYTELGRRRLGDVDVEGFETSNAELFAVPGGLEFLLPIKELTARVWIDVDSALPVSYEIDFTTHRALVAGLKRLRGKFVTHDIQWNAEVPQGIFDPNIPADYTRVNPTSVVQGSTAWLGVGAVPLAGVIVYGRRRRRHASRRPGRQA